MTVRTFTASARAGQTTVRTVRLGSRPEYPTPASVPEPVIIDPAASQPYRTAKPQPKIKSVWVFSQPWALVSCTLMLGVIALDVLMLVLDPGDEVRWALTLGHTVVLVLWGSVARTHVKRKGVPHE